MHGCFCLQLKKIIAHEFSVPVDQLCLLYGGKILREPGTVQNYSFKDGGIVHMAVKNPALVCVSYTIETYLY